MKIHKIIVPKGQKPTSCGSCKMCDDWNDCIALSIEKGHYIDVLEYAAKQSIHPECPIVDGDQHSNGKSFMCQGCLHELPFEYQSETDGYCHLCRPVTKEEGKK